MSGVLFKLLTSIWRTDVVYMKSLAEDELALILAYMNGWTGVSYVQMWYPCTRAILSLMAC
jgi:glycosylphosphatidylinositol transamidase (GPIT) subunit GPI8